MRFLIAIIILSIFSSVIMAFDITLTASVLPPGNCVESDADPNFIVQFTNAGSITGSFNYSSQIFTGTFPDSCSDEFHLSETLCGTTFGINDIAGVISINCQELGNYGCSLNACTPLQSFTYDDFSTGTLSPIKWGETAEGNYALMGEHFVELEHYHTQNIGTPDQRIILNMLDHTFVPGDMLEYDVDYISGSGNRVMVLFVNGQPLDVLLGNAGCLWCGSIGFNGQVFDIGNDFGLYHVKLQFTSNGFHYEVLRPNNTVYTKFVPNSILPGSSPYNLGFESWSNGAIHADYDNFVISHT